MGYLSKGYYAIGLSAVLSSVLFWMLFRFFLDTELEQPMFLAVNISIIGVQACGIFLCSIGFEKRETIDSLSFRLSIVLTVILILWSSFILLEIFYYVAGSEPYEIRLLMKDSVQFAAYVAWGIKGSIGFVSGLIFMTKLLMKR